MKKVEDEENPAYAIQEFKSPNSPAMKPPSNPPALNSTTTTASSKQKKQTRTTKSNQKLVVFPDDSTPASPIGAHLHLPQPETSGRPKEDDAIVEEDLYVEAEEVPRVLKEKNFATPGLQRVSAYCTGGEYKNKEILKFFESTMASNSTSPRIYDEVLYTTFASNLSNYWESNPFPSRVKRETSDSVADAVATLGAYHHFSSDVARAVASDVPFGEVFIFEYGVIVIWGLREEEEHSLLRSIRHLSVDPVNEEELEVEELRFRHDDNRPPRVCNDILYLKSGNPLVKLAISHAVAQSVKLTVFENRIENTINSTKHIPTVLAKTGDVQMSR
jgi:uncharacterized Rmd1/YagE family protein